MKYHFYIKYRKPGSRTTKINWESEEEDADIEAEKPASTEVS